jgi:hypothetical protein
MCTAVDRWDHQDQLGTMESNDRDDRVEAQEWADENTMAYLFEYPLKDELEENPVETLWNICLVVFFFEV